MEEVSACIRMVYDVYGTFGFENIVVKLSTRPEQRIGSDEAWDRAEAALAEALELNGLKYDLQPGEGAFYGPKIEFTLHDCLDRAGSVVPCSSILPCRAVLAPPTWAKTTNVIP
jgi:threonyl-tRNA synthetase